MKAFLLLLPLLLLSCKNEDEASALPESKKDSQKENVNTSNKPPDSPGQTSPDANEEILTPGTDTPPEIPSTTTPGLPRPTNTTRIPGNQDPDKAVPVEPAPTPTYRTAQPVPGKPGWVFNPWTNMAVDVRGIPPGGLVRDPNDSDPDHKFRTP